MVEQLDHGWFKTEWLIIKDDGPIKKRATHKYTVRARTHHLLGYVKWKAPWRQYVFFPVEGCLLDKRYLREISEFLDYSTAVWRARKAEKLAAWKARPRKKFRNLIDHEAVKQRDKEREEKYGSKF